MGCGTGVSGPSAFLDLLVRITCSRVDVCPNIPPVDPEDLNEATDTAADPEAEDVVDIPIGARVLVLYSGEVISTIPWSRRNGLTFLASLLAIAPSVELCLFSFSSSESVSHPLLFGPDFLLSGGYGVLSGWLPVPKDLSLPLLTERPPSLSRLDTRISGGGGGGLRMSERVARLEKPSLGSQVREGGFGWRPRLSVLWSRLWLGGVGFIVARE